jgi:hypothetical protein
MLEWFVSKETKENASLLCLTINILRKEIRDKGIEVVKQEISKNDIIRQFIPNYRERIGVDSFAFYFDRKLKEFLFWVEDERKIGGKLGLHIIAEDERYQGFGLYCDLNTGVITVDAADSITKVAS